MDHDGGSNSRFSGLRSLAGRLRGRRAPSDAERDHGQAAEPAHDEAAGAAKEAGRGEDAASEEVRSILATDAAQRYKSAEYEEFLDERVLVSRDALGTKEMKIKVLEVSDDHPPSKWKLGDRIKARRILVTIKHLDTKKVEEAEFDIEAIEAELAKKRHYTSSNRWIPTSDIKNGYVLKTRHMTLVSDAIALDYIAF